MKKAIIIFLIGLLLSIVSLCLYLATHHKEFFGICLLSAIFTGLAVTILIDQHLNDKS